MTVPVQLLSRLYAALLRLYPPALHAEFGAEMEAVFAEAAAGAAARGGTFLLALVLRELRDWPGALVRAHWWSLREETIMDEKLETVAGLGDPPSVLEERPVPDPWPEALLAGLPHALVALTVLAAGVAPAYGLLPFSGGQISVLEIVLRVALALCTMTAMVIAWRRGWPRWSASWFAYAFLLLALPLGAALQQWHLPASSWRLNLLLPQAYARLLVPLLLVGLLYALTLRSQLKVLLAVLPLVLLLWTPALEFTPDPARTVVMWLAWVCAALLAVLIARVGTPRTGVWMVLALSLGVGLAYTYLRTYHAQLPPDAPAHYRLPPTLLDWLNRFALAMLAISVVVLEPLLVRRLWLSGRRSAAMGVLGYCFALAGLVLLLAVALTASWWFASGAGLIKLAWGYDAARGVWLGLAACLAVLFCLSGVILLGAGAVRAGPWAGEVTSLFLAFLLVVMPLLVALPLISGLWEMRAIPQFWLYLVGVPWLSLATWLVTRQGAGPLSSAAA